MTGDSVNNAPSLKAANIGLALNNGSDITIKISDIILLDSFSAIVETIQRSPLFLITLKKTVAYLLPTESFAEFWPIKTNILFELPQIISSFLIIIIC